MLRKSGSQKAISLKPPINFVYGKSIGRVKEKEHNPYGCALFVVLGNVLLSQDPAVQVPSALEGLTV
ncbi:hypothetical protein, partial [Paenibacillus farraposensis]|uniref:hypothetical protein n=1 Tax=Paenibacillus farraposensis TaxID=2807095 RepID=UPI001E53F954